MTKNKKTKSHTTKNNKRLSLVTKRLKHTWSETTKDQTFLKNKKLNPTQPKTIKDESFYQKNSIPNNQNEYKFNLLSKKLNPS